MLKFSRVCKRTRSFLLNKNFLLGADCIECHVPVCFHLCSTNGMCSDINADGSNCNCKCTDADILHGLDVEDSFGLLCGCGHAAGYHEATSIIKTHTSTTTSTSSSTNDTCTESESTLKKANLMRTPESVCTTKNTLKSSISPILFPLMDTSILSTSNSELVSIMDISKDSSSILSKIDFVKEAKAIIFPFNLKIIDHDVLCNSYMKVFNLCHIYENSVYDLETRNQLKSAVSDLNTYLLGYQKKNDTLLSKNMFKLCHGWKGENPAKLVQSIFLLSAVPNHHSESFSRFYNCYRMVLVPV